MAGEGEFVIVKEGEGEQGSTLQSEVEMGPYGIPRKLS
jgi:hypothetical protein